MGGSSIEHEGIAEALSEQGFVLVPFKGTSMMPLLRQDRDSVVIVAAEPSELRPMDVVLFHDEATGHYVLHRLVASDADTLTTLGDHCVACERFPKERLVGRLSGIYRDERQLSLDAPAYRTYVTLWCRPWRLRVRLVRLWRAARRHGGRLLRALGLRRPS